MAVGIRAARRDVLVARGHLHDRPQRGRHHAAAGGRAQRRAARRGLGLLRPAVQAARLRARARAGRRADRVPRRAVAWGLSHVFSGRAMYMQIGAMLGTIMAANVLFVIIPSQRKLVEAKERGVRARPGLRAARQAALGAQQLLHAAGAVHDDQQPLPDDVRRIRTRGSCSSCLLLLAAYVRHFFNLRHRGRTVWAIPLTAAARRAGAGRRDRAREAGAAQRTSHCATCSRSSPRAARRATRSSRAGGLRVAPKGVLLERRRRSSRSAAEIHEQAVASRAMPIGNLTQMTDDERARSPRGSTPARAPTDAVLRT